jgi:glycosyltransferase involved in cell wall biosynthesis
MKIAIALGGTDAGRSGIGTYVRAVLPRLHTRLRENGDHLVALGTPRDLAGYRAELAGVTVVELPTALEPPAADALFHLVGAGAVAARAGADLLLLPAANRRLAVTSPVPTVAVVHDLAQLHLRGKYDPLRMLYVRRVLTPALGRATALVAVSHSTKRDMVAALSCGEDRVQVVENGVDSRRFTPAGDDDPRVVSARAKAGIQGPYLLYLARLEHPGKNHLRLVRAFAASAARRTHLLVLAGPDWGAEKLVRAEIARLGIQDRVRFLGWVADEVVPGVVAGADVVLMVGLAEGFGLPALEAFAAGRPVVNAEAGALPEVVGDLGIGCDPLSEASIGRGIERGLSDVALRARVAVEGPRRARARDWDRTADGLLAVCMEACA